MQTPASSRPPSLTISTDSDRPTNTLIIPSLPESFFQPLVLNALRDHFASYGDLYAWSPLKGFRRILVVYRSDDDADAARESDGLVIGEDPLSATAESPNPQQHPTFSLRVYRGDPTPLTAYSDTLHPPEIPHNFLISPPGSPPVGWEQVREEPPNTVSLADDLVRALEALKLERERAGRGDEPHVLISPGARPGAPSVTVLDYDWGTTVPLEEEGGRMQTLRTMRPPVAVD